MRRFNDTMLAELKDAWWSEKTLHELRGHLNMSKREIHNGWKCLRDREMLPRYRRPRRTPERASDSARFDGKDGRPHIGSQDKLLARLKMFHVFTLENEFYPNPEAPPFDADSSVLA